MNPKEQKSDDSFAKYVLEEACNGIFISDPNTYEMIFANKAFENILQKKLPTETKVKCYEYCMGQNAPCEFCFLKNLDKANFFERELSFPNTDKRVLLQGKKIDWQGREVVIEYVTDVTERYKESCIIQKERQRLEELQIVAQARYQREVTLRKELLKKAISYFRMNLTTQLVEEIFYSEIDTSYIQMPISTENFFKLNVFSNIYSDDKKLVMESLAPETMLQNYYSGKVSESFLFRYNLPNKGVVWIKGTVSKLRRTTTDEIIAFFTAENVEEEETNHQLSLCIVGEEIENVDLLNLNQNSVRSVMRHHKIIQLRYEDGYKTEPISYEDYYKFFFQYMGKEESKNLQEQLKIEYIVEELKTKDVIQHIFSVEKDGERRWKKMRIFYLDSVKQKIVFVQRDITDLYNNIEELKTALNHAKSASQAKGDFMSRMSHEIRTPLNAIIGFQNIALESIDNREDVKKRLEQSQGAAQHLLKIINDVLDISSIESGRMKIEKSAFDLTQLISTIQEVYTLQASQKQINFKMDVDKLESDFIVGDSLRLKQILLNLMTNAMKFTPANGTVCFTMKHVSSHSDKVHLKFSVSDTGIGIKPEFLEHLFTPFEQESASTARNFGGTGLGLAISNNLVKMMGGVLEVKSEYGKGTTFEASLAFDKCQEPQNKIATLSLNCLIIAENETDLSNQLAVLSELGVKVTRVNSVKKALRRIESRRNENPFDFCIAEPKTTEIEKEMQNVGIDNLFDSRIDAERLKDKLSSLNYKNSNKLEKIDKNKNEDTKIDFNGMKILLAEDNDMNMEISLDILQKAGMIITPVRNGKEAVDVFEKSKIDEYKAIILDIQMPVMDGYEAARFIRKSEHPQAKQIPIIAMSANAFTSDVTASLAAGMNDHISKPINSKALFTSIAKLTNKNTKKNEVKE